MRTLRLAFAVVLILGLAGCGVERNGTVIPDSTATDGSETPSEAPTAEPQAETYTYDGPKYEIVSVDEDFGPAELSKHWVLTEKFDYSTDAYKDQVKMIITDIVREENTANITIEIVTDRDVAKNASVSTMDAFVEKHGKPYILSDVLPKYEANWAASYTGGFDYETWELSSSVGAFVVTWRPHGGGGAEEWQPQLEAPGFV